MLGNKQPENVGFMYRQWGKWGLKKSLVGVVEFLLVWLKATTKDLIGHFFRIPFHIH